MAASGSTLPNVGFLASGGESGNSRLIEAFRKRIKNVAKFEYVPEPLPMKNSGRGRVLSVFCVTK